MKCLRKIRFRLGALFRRSKFDAEMEAEMQMHLELRIERNVAAGMSPEEARYAALRSFGGLDQLKERARDQRGGVWLGHLIRDVRFGGRMLRKSPGFTVTAVLTLSLGIGACAAVFSVINTTVLHPFAYPGLDRLVVIYESFPPKNPKALVSLGAASEFQKESTAFSSVTEAYFQPHNVTRAQGEPIRAQTEHVAANFFSTLEVQPILGRAFRPSEINGKGDVAILSHRLWLSDFGGLPSVMGQTIFVDGQAVTIIGVMPAGFQSGSTGPSLYQPFNVAAQMRQSFAFHGLQVIGRLRDGMTLAQANTELGLVAKRLGQQYPATNKGWGASAVSLVDDTIAFARPLLFTLLGAVGFLLLIACVNIANLLLARATARRKEIAIRLAVGASRWHVVRQLLCEGLLLSLLGGALGLFFARGSMRLMVALAPADLPRASEIRVDGPAVLFTAVLVLLTGLGFGLVPAFQATRVDLNGVLKDSGRGTSGDRNGLRLRPMLVVLEVALALVLLVGAGLLTRSFLKFQAVDQGFQRENLYVAPLNLDPRKYASKQSQVAFANQVVAEVSRIHGVNSTAITVGKLTMSGGFRFKFGGQPELPPSAQPTALVSCVTPDYLKTMGIPLLRGRSFTPKDSATTPPVVFINREMARLYFAGHDPIGQRVCIIANVLSSLGTVAPAVWREVVGVVGNVEAAGIDSPIRAQIYIPFAQEPGTYLNLGVRLAPNVPLDIHAVAAAIHAMERDLPFTTMLPMDAINDVGTPAVRRFSMALSLVFSGVALFLAAIGIYGVMAFTVAQRTGEIGIRLALGADRGDLLQMILMGGGRMLGLGLIVGVLGALALTRLISSLLYNVSSSDPGTVLGITLILTLVGFLACWIPAWRATKIDPLVALRTE